MNRHSLRCLLSALPFCVATAAAGSLNPTLNEDFTLRLGAGLMSNDARVRSDLKGGDVSAEVNLNDLGIDDNSSTPYAGLRWRFADRWKLDLEYFGTHQDGSGVTTGNIEFGDVRIPFGVQASTSLDVDLYSVSVGWSFIRSERTEVGVGLGLHVADLKTQIRGAGTVGGIPTPVATGTADTTAPLPNIRLYGGYAFTPTLAAEAGLGYFSLNYGDYDGHWFSGTAVLEWRPAEHFGVGAGYAWFDVNVDVDNTNTRDTYDFTLQGPVLFVSAGF